MVLPLKRESKTRSLLARLKRLQAEALVRMVSPATEREMRIYHDGEAAAYGNVLKMIGGEDD